MLQGDLGWYRHLERGQWEDEDYSLFFPLQFTSVTSPQTLSMTLRACVFFKNSLTDGFSLVLPLCLCCPKQFSSGSWHILPLRKDVTPGMVKMNLTISTKDRTAGMYKVINAHHAH